MSYFTIREEAVVEFHEKKSRFIASIKRVESEEEAKSFLQKIKDQYKEARHNVYAYIIGNNKGIQRYSDDGEPKGTGGIPVLDVLNKNNLTDVVVVVTRYFGGVLLGASGLGRAYSNSASMALESTSIVEKVVGNAAQVAIEYELLGKVKYSFAKENLYIDEVNYSDKVIINLNVEKSRIVNLETLLMNITFGKVIINLGEDEYFFKQDNRLFREFE